MSSAEEQVHSALTAHAPLVAMVGNRIAANAIPEGGGAPCVAYVVRTEAIDTLLGEGDDLQATVSVQCWARNPADARALADLVRAAVAGAPAARCAYVASDGTIFDEEGGLDGVQLDVEWWP